MRAGSRAPRRTGDGGDASFIVTVTWIIAATPRSGAPLAIALARICHRTRGVRQRIIPQGNPPGGGAGRGAGQPEVHKGERVRQIIEGYGCELLFLPAYSPDLSPIEGMVSKVKQALRRASERTQAGLVAGIRAALDTVTAQDAAGWFAHCSHPSRSDQSL
jgi:hypothetical protein